MLQLQLQAVDAQYDAVKRFEYVPKGDDVEVWLIGSRYRVGDLRQERKISDDLYSKLRSKTPNKKIKNKVNESYVEGMDDFALDGLTINKPLHADHIVPMDEISRMDNFDLLNQENQLQVKPFEEMIIGIENAFRQRFTSKSFSPNFEGFKIFKK